MRRMSIRSEIADAANPNYRGQYAARTVWSACNSVAILQALHIRSDVQVAYTAPAGVYTVYGSVHRSPANAVCAFEHILHPCKVW